MLILNELQAKASMTQAAKKALDKTRLKVTVPTGFVLTCYDHHDPISFCLHHAGVDVVFTWVGTQLSVINYQGMTGVDAYLLLQEFKQLNS